MKPGIATSRYLRFVLLGILQISAYSAHAAFYQEGGIEWGYRAPISLDNASAPGSTIILDVDFDALLGQTTAPGTLEPNSIRIVKNETTLVGEQEFNDSVFTGSGDPINNGQGEVRFILEDAPGASSYFLYFDIVANGAKPTNPALVVNGSFEQATGAPTRWSTASQAVGGAQNNESYQSLINSTFPVPAGCSTGAATVDNSPNNNGSQTTGRGWHLLGYRDQCEDGSGGNERVRLTRSLRIPAGAAAGSLDFSFQVQAWDGISNATNYDWFAVFINNTVIDHTNIGVAAGSPTLVIEASRFGRSAFGTGLVDHGWRDASVNLSAFAGTTISLRFEARFSAADNAYRSWLKLDDVQWSTTQATVGSPELNSASVASFVISHDGTGIYCLGEPIRIRAVDAAGSVIPDFVGNVTLDTQQSAGQFSLTSGSGAFSSTATGTAFYGFVVADQGDAEFLLNYPSGTPTINIDAFLTGDSTIRDLDTEGSLTFSPNGFTFTATPLSNPPSLPLDTTISPQISAVNFPLYITAYGETEDDPTCGVIETYTGNKPLRFWQEFSDPNTGTLNSTINGVATALSAAAATDQTINFSAGQATLTAQYPDVGEIRIAAADNSIVGLSISGSTNNFVVKPARLEISRIQSQTGLSNPAATLLTGAGFVAAGEAFVVDIDSINANNAITPNFGRESTSERVAVNSEALVLPAGGLNGSTGNVINGDSFTASATAGRYTNNTVLFDESGIISLRPQLLDNDYMGAGDVTRIAIPRVGRFYPARFELVSGFVGANCGPFTYMSEPAIDLSFEIQAQNVAGNPLNNYSDNLYSAGATANFQLTAENDNNGTDLTTRLSTTSSSWINGRLGDTTQISLARAALPDGPYSQLAIGARIIDPLENSLIENAELNPATNTNCNLDNSCSARQIGATTEVLYGRMLALPAQGPETSALHIGLETQFFNGLEFERNAADSCTTYNQAAASLANFTENLQAGETTLINPPIAAPFAAGRSQATNPLTLSAPGTGNFGSVDLTFGAPSWLTFDWFGTGNTDPSATATFGGFRGHDRIIYWQEQR